MLYPLKFIPIFKEKIWGGTKLKTILNKKIEPNKKIGESWELSGVQGNISIVKNGHLEGEKLSEILSKYKENFIGKKNYKIFKNNFPLLIKFLDANEILSLQVHPGDKFAQEKYKQNGKSEMWFIIQADKNAEIITGFNKDTNKKEYESKVEEQNLKSILNFEKTWKSDAFFIPSGRIHSIDKGNLIAEIQQSSDITYRISDWERTDKQGNKRELHTENAKKVLDYEYKGNLKCKYKKISDNKFIVLKSDFFSVNYIKTEKNISLDYSKLDSFIIYMCIEGEFELVYNKTDIINVSIGETIIIPAIIDKVLIKTETETEILEIYI